MKDLELTWIKSHLSHTPSLVTMYASRKFLTQLFVCRASNGTDIYNLTKCYLTLFVTKTSSNIRV